MVEEQFLCLSGAHGDYLQGSSSEEMGPVLPVSLSYFPLGLPSLGAPGQEGTPLPRVREGGSGLGKTSTAGLERPVVEATVLAALGVQGSSTKEWIVNLGYKLVNSSPSLGPSFLHSALSRHDPWPPPSPSPPGLPGFVLLLQLVGKSTQGDLSLAHLRVRASLSTPLQPFLGASGFSGCPPNFLVRVETSQQPLQKEASQGQEVCVGVCPPLSL